jgi:hypothetical protein
MVRLRSLVSAAAAAIALAHGLLLGHLLCVLARLLHLCIFHRQRLIVTLVQNPFFVRDRGTLARFLHILIIFNFPQSSINLYSCQLKGLPICSILVDKDSSVTRIYEVEFGQSLHLHNRTVRAADFVGNMDEW